MTNSVRALANIDFNLLVPLYVLLQERSVSKAAQMLGISQPACSHALKRLRALYADPLLVRGGGRLHELTPMGKRLATQLESTIEGISRVGLGTGIRSGAPIDITREFVLLMADSEKLLLAPGILDAASTEAPRASFRFEQSTLEGEQDVIAHLHQVDVRIVPESLTGSLPALRLFNDEWVCLVAEDHRLTADARPEDFAEVVWVTAYDRPPWAQAPFRALEFLDQTVRVVATTESFVVLHSLVVGSDRVALLPRSTARYLAALGGARIIPAPFAADPVTLHMIWHPIHEHDDEHVWLRSLIARIAARHEDEVRLSKGS